MLPPTTATEVQIVCPKVAPTATPSAFLCVASCRTKNSCQKFTRPRQNTWLLQNCNLRLQEHKTPSNKKISHV
ncbi:hypothetical protein OIU76_016293 [Salix suchowensis]|nr:hypothetical protein OIU76_016293 [Salix suchowensis]